MEPITERTKLAILEASIETWLRDNTRGLARASSLPDDGGRVIAIEGKIVLHDLAKYALHRVRKLEGAKL